MFKLINEILLFRYSEGNFLAHTRAVTLTLPHITEIITLSNAYEIVPELIIFTEIQTHEY